MNQRIAYATSKDGTRIAYAVSGDGPPLVRPATWVTHIGIDADGPTWGHWWRELSRDHTFIRYDMRGNGLSEREVFDFSLDAEVSDLEAVVEAAGLDSFDMLGHSNGATVGLAYASRHPTKVRRIAVINGFISGPMTRPFGASEAAKARRAMMLSAWEVDATRKFWVSWFIPDSTQAEIDAAAELLLACSSAEVASRLARPLTPFSVAEMLGKIRTPTLVMHSVRNEMVPVASGRRIATSIPHARFVELDSRNHILTSTEPAWQQFVAEVREFLSHLSASEDSARFDFARAATEGLSRREAQVLALVCDGANDKEIADVLGIEKRTASNHVNSLLRRTGARNRAHAVAWAARHRLI